MTQSLTDWLQESRLIVVSVDESRRRLRLKGVADVCSDYSCSERTVVVTDEDAAAGLGALNAGDIVDRKSTRLNSSHIQKSRMPSSA